MKYATVLLVALVSGCTADNPNYIADGGRHRVALRPGGRHGAAGDAVHHGRAVPLGVLRIERHLLPRVSERQRLPADADAADALPERVDRRRGHAGRRAELHPELIAI